MKSQKSQNINFKIPKFITRTGKILQASSLALATRFAAKIFITPINHKVPKREKTMQKSAQQELIHIPNINKNVMVYSYGYSKKKVLLVHGWSGRGTQLIAIADKILENRMMTVSFDAPAHGKSSGKQTMMNEFIESVKVIDKKYGPFDVAIGHSLGGMTLLNCVADGLNIKKLIVIGSGDTITEVTENFVSEMQLKPLIATRLKTHFDHAFGENIDNYSGSVAAKKVKIPTLVIHDTHDKDVAVSCAHNIRQNLEQGEILITHQLGHRRILKDQKVIKRILEFIKR